MKKIIYMMIAFIMINTTLYLYFSINVRALEDNYKSANYIENEIYGFVNDNNAISMVDLQNRIETVSNSNEYIIIVNDAEIENKVYIYDSTGKWQYYDKIKNGQEYYNKNNDTIYALLDFELPDREIFYSFEGINQDDASFINAGPLVMGYYGYYKDIKTWVIVALIFITIMCTYKLINLYLLSQKELIIVHLLHGREPAVIVDKIMRNIIIVLLFSLLLPIILDYESFKMMFTIKLLKADFIQFLVIYVGVNLFLVFIIALNLYLNISTISVRDNITEMNYG